MTWKTTLRHAVKVVVKWLVGGAHFCYKCFKMLNFFLPTELSGGLPVLIPRRHRPMFLLHKGGHFFFSVALQSSFIIILKKCMYVKQ